jgi:hypothetical protein
MIEREFDDRDERDFDRVRDTGERLTTADIAGKADERSSGGRASQGIPSAAKAVPAAEPEERAEPLFAEDEWEDFRARWKRIQAGFVDEPRMAVEEADELVAAVIKRLAEVFAKERSNLEQDWARGDDVSTEDLRIALRRYRSFFDRLLSV